MYHMRARYYNPDLKRFINRDVVQGSILEPQTFNRYAYVNGNPISYIDPFGLSREHDGNLLTGVWNFFIGDDLRTLTDPNASALSRAWAGISLASNFIPGAGPAFKGFKLLAKGIGKGISNTLKNLPKTNRITKRGIQCHCFTAGTKVLTEFGYKNIEDVQVGDRILAKDDKTGDIAYKEVLHLFQRVVTETYNIHVNGEVITTTDEHPFWVKDKGWVEAQDLTVKDKLLDKDGNELIIDDIVIKEEKVLVYNFEVANYNSYFVSDLGIWVHNACYSPSYYSSKLSGTIDGKQSHQRVTKRNSGSDSSKLQAEMKKWGLKKEKYWEAHHIIPINDSRIGDHVRNTMKIFDIDLNSAANGVYLPKRAKYRSTTATDENGVLRELATHSGRHVDSYMGKINNDFHRLDFQSRNEVLEYIHELRTQLLNVNVDNPLYLQRGKRGY